MFYYCERKLMLLKPDPQEIDHDFTMPRPPVQPAPSKVFPCLFRYNRVCVVLYI